MKHVGKIEVDMRGCVYPALNQIEMLRGFQSFIHTPKRESSPEHDFGCHWKWREGNAPIHLLPSARISWIEDTGELYAVFFDFNISKPDRYILIGVYPKEEQVEFAMRDWATIEHHDLRAIIIQARGGAKAKTYADVEGERDPLEAPFKRALDDEQFSELETMIDKEDRGLPYKVYRGDVLPDGECRVRVIENGVSRLLEHYGVHSPSGFAWGYGGSGPAETALNILADFFGEHETFTLRKLKSSHKAQYKFHAFRRTPNGELLYQVFKRQVIAGFAQDKSWRYTENDLRAWLAKYPNVFLDVCVQCGETASGAFHCRQCGDPLCANCGADEIYVRLCDECFDKSEGGDA